MLQTLRKYAVTLDDATAGSRKISFLPYKVGTNVFATSGDWSPAAADFKVAKAVTGAGLGAEASIGTAPTWVNGRVVIILSGAELTCRYLTIRIENAAINSDEIVVETYGNASAQYPHNYVDAVRLGMTALPNGTQMADLWGRAVAVTATGGTTTTAVIPLQGHSWVHALLLPTSGSNDSVPRVVTSQSDATDTTLTVSDAFGTAVAAADTFLLIPLSNVAVESTGYALARVKNIDNNAISAGAIAASALNGKGDWGTATALAAVATQITNLNNLSALANIYGPQAMEIPDAGSVDFPFTIVVRDNEGKLVDLDASPTLAASNAAGTSRSANLSAVTHAATGRYTFTYTVAAAAAEEGLRITGDGTVSAEGRHVEYVGAVVNYDTLTTIAAIKAKTDNLPADPASTTNVTAVFNRLGAPAGASTAADIAAAKAVIDHVRTSTDLLPTDPASETLVQTAVDLAGAASANSSSLLARVGAFTGTGVNTVLGSLKAIFSSSAATPTDIGGTGTAANNSLQAIRARGDAAWLTGGGGGGGFSGASAVTLTFHDAGGAAVPDVVFTIVGVGTGATDGTGVITIGLNDGSYTVRTAPVSGTLFADAALVVAGTTALTVTGTADVIPAPTTPGLAAGYCDLFDTLGAPAAGGQIEIQRTDTTGAAGTSALRESTFADANDAGRVVVNVEGGKTFRARRDGGPWVAFTAPANGTFALPHVLGQAGGN